MRIQPLLLCAEPRALCPALTLAAIHALTDDDPVLLAMPVEQSVARAEAFQRSLQQAAALAQEGYVVAFGMPSSSPQTGYGAIRVGGAVTGCGVGQASYVESFADRPGQQWVAQLVHLYPESERLLWNAGIFMVRASVWIEALACLRRDILAACEHAYGETRRDAGIWSLRDKTHSADFAVLDAIAAGSSPGGPSPEAVVVRLEAGSAAMRAWDLVGPCSQFELAPHRLVARVSADDAVLVEIPSFDETLQAA
jgi:mannose-1-phosphate guanylyltransferase/mannose-6-phosphate isomerase